MRKLEEIEGEITRLIGELDDIHRRLTELNSEKIACLRANFEKKYHIKRGDLLEFDNDVKMLYDYVQISEFGNILYGWRVSRDGTPNKYRIYRQEERMSDVKVIGHVELSD